MCGSLIDTLIWRRLHISHGAPPLKLIQLIHEAHAAARSLSPGRAALRTSVARFLAETRGVRLIPDRPLRAGLMISLPRQVASPFGRGQVASHDGACASPPGGRVDV